MARKTKVQPAKITNKVGTLSNEEKKYILQNSGTLPDEEIAKNLKRNVEPITKFRIQNATVAKGDKVKTDALIRLKEELHCEPEWPMIKKQHSPEELALFEFGYVQLVNQFKGDILPTEKKQIFMALNTEIKIYRHNSEEKRVQIEIERMEILLHEELDKDPKHRDNDIIQTLQAQINAARSAKVQRAKEYNDLSNQLTNTLKSIKGTREQRIQKIEETKETFVGLLRRLEDEDMRKSVALENFIMSEGIKSKKKELSNLHTYMDGRVDPLILDSESVCEISTTQNIESGDSQ